MELSFFKNENENEKVEKLVPESEGQKDVCSTHQKSGSSIKAWFKIKKDLSGH